MLRLYPLGDSLAAIGASGASAGPAITLPSGLKREPWHGQSHVLSASFQSTMHAMCVQTADTLVT